MKTNNQLTIFTGSFGRTFLATICCLLWGSAFPAIKLGYRCLRSRQKRPVYRYCLQDLALHWREWMCAVDLYSKGEISLGQGAKIAGMETATVVSVATEAFVENYA